MVIQSETSWPLLIVYKNKTISLSPLKTVLLSEVLNTQDTQIWPGWCLGEKEGKKKREGGRKGRIMMPMSETKGTKMYN